MNASIRWIGFSLVALLILIPSAAARAESKTLRSGHVVVRYDGITEPQARSLARVADAARTSALERYGFDVPETIKVNVDCRLDNSVRLYTNGQDTYTLTLRTGFDLAPSGVCGIYNLYGMCHELGHVVMYRVLKHRDWLSSEACEGWAHYFGSRVVDDVYATEGQGAWWMPYDYRADGMARLESQLESESTATDATTAAAGAWLELSEIIGELKMPALFAAWNAAEIRADDPAAAVLAALRRVSSDPRVETWWGHAHPILLAEKPAAAQPRAATHPAPASRPAADSASELAIDDGKSAGKLSIAGSGHAASFETPAGDGYVLTEVKIYGSRYGTAAPPAEDFHVYLCDSDGKQLADCPFPYKNFTRGGQRWVSLKLDKPIEVPRHFILCAIFNPTATKGVYVHYDKSVDGDSRTGLPGNLNDAFDKGDWMIRAVVRPAKP